MVVRVAVPFPRRRPAVLSHGAVVSQVLAGSVPLRPVACRLTVNLRRAALAARFVVFCVQHHLLLW
jgi:hypothetical protein